jgi:hypothetical protein
VYIVHFLFPGLQKKDYDEQHTDWVWECYTVFQNIFETFWVLRVIDRQLVDQKPLSVHNLTYACKFHYALHYTFLMTYGETIIL